MPYRVNCPACKTACLVADESLGKKLLCGKCRQPFTVGNPKPPAPAAPKPPLPSASKAATGRTTTDLPPRPPSKAPSPRNAIQSTAAPAPPPARRNTSPLLIVGILAVILLVLGGALAGAIVAGIYFLQPRSETPVAQTPAANNEQPGQVAPAKEKADPPADAPTAPQATTEEPINPKPMPVSDNLKVIKTIPLTTYRRIHDFALHPKKKIAFLSVENTVAKVLDEPAEALRIVSINEESGEVAELPRIYGRWIAVDPEGKYLIAAYKDVFKTGEHYHLNPDWNLITIPEYGNIDMLMRYSLASGTPRLEEVLRKAGGNGQRLVLSPDGEQSAYLSFVGYPDFSRNIAAFDVVNLKKEAVTYRTKDHADCRRLVDHPLLDLVASPGSGSAVLYNRRSGEEEAQRLKLTAKGLGKAQVDDLMFSADGKYLIFAVTEVGRGRYLHSVPINLTATELNDLKTGKVRKPLPSPAKTENAAPGNVQAPKTPQEAEAILDKLGFKIKHLDDKPDKPVVSLVTYSDNVSDDHLLLLRFFRDSLKELGLASKNVSDKGMKHLAVRTKLEDLSVGSGCRFTGQGLADLKDLTELRSLSCLDAQLGDDVLVHLKAFKKLTYLELGGNKGITDKGVAHLKDLTNLETLRMRGISMTEKGVKELKKALKNTIIVY